jgi:hypothetical protein
MTKKQAERVKSRIVKEFSKHVQVTKRNFGWCIVQWNYVKALDVKLRRTIFDEDFEP